MKKILSGWNFLRLLRLALGVLIFINGVATAQWIVAGLGALFAGLAIANIGCCGTGACYTIPSKKQELNNHDSPVIFEEIKK